MYIMLHMCYIVYECVICKGDTLTFKGCNVTGLIFSTIEQKHQFLPIFVYYIIPVITLGVTTNIVAILRIS